MYIYIYVIYIIYIYPKTFTCNVRNIQNKTLSNGPWCYPTFSREFQGLGKFVFRTLELTDTPTNLANEVKVGHALNQSRSVQSAPKQCTVMAIVEDRLPTFETVLIELSGCICKTKTHLNGFFDTDCYSVFLIASWVAKCQLTSWRSVSKKPRTWVFIIL